MSDFKPIETQEAFDEAIRERLKREGDTIRKEYEGYLSPEAEAEKYEGYLSEKDVQEKYKGYLSPEEAEKKDAAIKGYELKEKRVKIALSEGIPYELSGKITGETEEEMKKDAKTLAGFLKKGSPYPDYTPEPTTKDSKYAAMKKMLEDLKGE